MKESPLSKFLSGKINWQESYASLILGAIIVIILGLLVANFLTRRGQNQQIDTGEQTQKTQEEAAAPSAGSEYTIRENDSLSKIAEQVYGSQEAWPAIAKANNIANPNKVMAGVKIKLPSKEEVGPVAQATPQASSAEQEKAQAEVKDQSKADLMTATSYQVKAGDTFFTIAERVYGYGSMWPKLHKANGSRRLPNGNPLVFADTTIVIPR